MEFRTPDILNVTSGNLDLNFKVFKEQIDIYFVATETNKKSREVQVARLKNLMGSEALRLYVTIKPSDNHNETVESVLEILEKYCSPRKNITIEVYKFFNRKQNNCEPFDKFYTDLKYLVTSCDFKDQEDKLLKTQIILGINNKGTQERLLREDTSLEKSVAFCRSVESAETNLALLNEQDTIRNVNLHDVSRSDIEQKTVCVDRADTRLYNKLPNNKNKEFRPSNKVCNQCGTLHDFKKCPA